MKDQVINQKQTIEKVLYFRAGAKTYLKKLAKVRPKNRTSENSPSSHKWSLFPDPLSRLARYIQKCSNTGFFFHFFRRKWSGLLESSFSLLEFLPFLLDDEVLENSWVLTISLLVTAQLDTQNSWLSSKQVRRTVRSVSSQIIFCASFDCVLS